MDPIFANLVCFLLGYVTVSAIQAIRIALSSANAFCAIPDVEASWVDVFGISVILAFQGHTDWDVDGWEFRYRGFWRPSELTPPFCEAETELLPAVKL